MHTAIQVKLSEPFTQHSQLFLITKSISAWLMCQQISYHHAATTTTTITTSSTTTREYKAHAKKKTSRNIFMGFGRVLSWTNLLARPLGTGRRKRASHGSKKRSKTGRRLHRFRLPFGFFCFSIFPFASIFFSLLFFVVAFLVTRGRHWRSISSFSSKIIIITFFFFK